MVGVGGGNEGTEVTKQTTVAAVNRTNVNSTNNRTRIHISYSKFKFQLLATKLT